MKEEGKDVIVDIDADERGYDSDDDFDFTAHNKRQYIKFLTQVGFGGAIVVFSMVQIARNDVEDKAIFYGLLSGTLSAFMPNPTIAAVQRRLKTRSK